MRRGAESNHDAEIKEGQREEEGWLPGCRACSSTLHVVGGTGSNAQHPDAPFCVFICLSKNASFDQFRYDLPRGGLYAARGK